MLLPQGAQPRRWYEGPHPAIGTGLCRGGHPAVTVKVAEHGATVAMDVWEPSAEPFGSFVDGIPAPLGMGKVALAEGNWVSGFV